MVPYSGRPYLTVTVVPEVFNVTREYMTACLSFLGVGKGLKLPTALPVDGARVITALIILFGSRGPYNTVGMFVFINSFTCSLSWIDVMGAMAPIFFLWILSFSQSDVFVCTMALSMRTCVFLTFFLILEFWRLLQWVWLCPGDVIFGSCGSLPEVSPIQSIEVKLKVDA